MEIDLGASNVALLDAGVGGGRGVDACCCGGMEVGWCEVFGGISKFAGVFGSVAKVLLSWVLDWGADVCIGTSGGCIFISDF